MPMGEIYWWAGNEWRKTIPSCCDAGGYYPYDIYETVKRVNARLCWAFVKKGTKEEENANPQIKTE